MSNTMFSLNRPSKKDFSSLLIGDKNLNYGTACTLFGQVLTIDALAGDYAFYFDEVGPMEEKLQEEYKRIEHVAKAMISAEKWNGDDLASFNLAVRYHRMRDVEDLCLRTNMRMSDFMYEENGRDWNVLYFPHSNTPYLLSASIINMWEQLSHNKWIPKDLRLEDVLKANGLPYYAFVDVASEMAP